MNLLQPKRAFKLRASEGYLGEWGDSYVINANHKWKLPGVDCHACRATWGMGGVEYPTIDLETIDHPEAYTQRWPVTPEELDALRRPIRQIVGGELDLPPGTRFGPLIGTAKGEFGDFAWVPVATLLVRRESLTKLGASGVDDLNTADTQLTFDSVPAPDFVELEIPLAAELHQGSYADSVERPTIRCNVCGRIQHGTYARTVVEGNSLPEHFNLLWPRNHPTIILASERFCQTVHEFDLTGIRCEEVAVV